IDVAFYITVFNVGRAVELQRVLEAVEIAVPDLRASRVCTNGFGLRPALRRQVANGEVLDGPISGVNPDHTPRIRVKVRVVRIVDHSLLPIFAAERNQRFIAVDADKLLVDALANEDQLACSVSRGHEVYRPLNSGEIPAAVSRDHQRRRGG